MTTLINADTSGGLKLTSDTSGALGVQSAGSTKIAMDTSGNVDVVAGNMSIAPDKDTSNTSGKFLCVEGTSQTNPSVIIQKGAAANYGLFSNRSF
jgi:hypothetical protein